jgi:hypothetical protein
MRLLLSPRVFIALVLIAATGFIAFLLVDTVSKETATRSTMWVVKRRILLYAHENNHLPHSLAEIPMLPRHNNSIKDAWGRPLGYQINDDKTVTLISLGRDGLPGRVGENADIVLSFAIHGVDGRWSDPLVHWLKD